MFQSNRGDQALLPFKQQLRQLEQKTAWYLNFNVNPFDFTEGKEWGSLLDAKLATNVSRRIHRGVKNYNEIPA